MHIASGRHLHVRVCHCKWREINEMSALLRSDDDDQDERYREWNDRVRVGLSAMWCSHRFLDRYPPPMAPGAARDLGSFSRGIVLDEVWSFRARGWDCRSAVGACECGCNFSEQEGQADRVDSRSRQGLLESKQQRTGKWYSNCCRICP